MKKSETHTATRSDKKSGPFFSKGSGPTFFPADKKAQPFFSKSSSLVHRDGTIQRKCAACEKEQKKVQKKPETADPTTASSSIESSLSASKGSGSPLPNQTRKKMESSFGADFSGVRIHNDNTSVKMNKDLHAQAFTHGKDIYFNSGKYDGESRAGRHLLAHELTHVVQQTGNRDSIQRFPSWEEIKEEAGEVVDEVESGVSAAGEAIASGVDAVTDWVSSEAGKVAVALAEEWEDTFGAVVTILEGGGIQVRLPDVPILDRYSKTLPWDAATPDTILGQFPVELGELGILFLTLFVRGQINAALSAGIGPVQLKDIILTIDPKSDYYSGEATLFVPADISGMLELTGILGGTANWNCAIEVIKIEGGLSGRASAQNSLELNNKTQVTYQDGEFKFDNNTALSNCLEFNFDLNALANLSLLETPVWSGNWNLANWPWEKCWNFSFPIKEGDENGFVGGGGESGGGGASGSWDDEGSGSQLQGGGSSSGASLPADTGNAGQPNWDATELLKIIFSSSSFQPQTNLAALDKNAKAKVQAACPIKKDKSAKGYRVRIQLQHKGDDVVPARNIESDNPITAQAGQAGVDELMTRATNSVKGVCTGASRKMKNTIAGYPPTGVSAIGNVARKWCEEHPDYVRGIRMDLENLAGTNFKT